VVESQEEYTAEGIDWSHIEFVDNQDCLDTIDQKPPKGLGVMTVLDDQCNFPRSTDNSFCNTIRERVKSARFSYKPGPHIDFIIEHYAGPVTYDCAGFLDKNRDTVSVDIVSALTATSSNMLQQLLPYIQLNLEGKSKATVASRFREQLLDLVSRLDCTEMHFVRCAVCFPGLHRDALCAVLVVPHVDPRLCTGLPSLPVVWLHRAAAQPLLSCCVHAHCRVCGTVQ
jgi:myosin V